MSVPSRRIILLLLVAAGVYLAGNAQVSLWDRDEPRYAQCSRQMLQGNDWVVPRLYDDLRTAKPPLIYWCQAAAMRLFGREGGAGAFSARLPSSLAVLSTLALLAIVVTRRAGADQAFWTVLVLAGSGLTIMAAKICTTDGVLLLFTTIAQLCLFALWRGNRSWGIVLLMAVALGLGGLTKGPFILGVVACTAVALGAFRLAGKEIERRKVIRKARGLEPVLLPAHGASSPAGHVPGEGRENLASDETSGVNANRAPLSPGRVVAQVLVGIAIIAAIVVPWLYLVQHREPEFLGRMFHEAKGHLEEGREGHHFPPGYHLVVVWGTFMPWSLLLPMAIGIGIRNRKIPEVRFALAATVGPWLMVEFLGTKLPHYLLPAFPAMAFLTAWAIRDCINRTARDMESRLFRVGTGIWAAIVACVGLVPWLAARTFSPQPWGVMVLLTIATLALAATVFSFFHARKVVAGAAAMGLGMLVLTFLAYAVFLPSASYMRVSMRVANDLIKAGATHKGDVYMVDYKEPSLGFYQDGTIRERKREFLSPRHRDEWPQWLAVTAEAWNEAAPDVRRAYYEIAREKGWAYSDSNRVVEVIVVEKGSGRGG
ncbi:MAG TPA: glycosyltransferase family 39 protein [Tepidisphaeraceae bacterium]|jgi:4-amino-4-deoxy-L-arabinose transferase-like glycosyltransferase|nr:glycosyltransferase family 39 protein [Tepidisphaeraceae bacterium]